MPLTTFQMRLGRLLAANRTEDSYLAGGAAILAAPNSLRFSHDLGYFHDSAARVASAFEADTTSLRADGNSVDIEISQPGYIRAIVSGHGGTTKIEWAQDSTWRFMPVGLILTQEFNTLAKISRIQAPLLIVHGTNDAIVPYEMGERLFSAATSPRKRFIRVEGGSHHNLSSVAFEQYRAAVLELFRAPRSIEAGAPS